MDPRMVPKSIQNRLFGWSKASELQHLISGVPGGGSPTQFHSKNDQKIIENRCKNEQIVNVLCWYLKGTVAVRRCAPIDPPRLEAAFGPTPA